MICPKCGKEIEDGKKFCSGCGYKFPEKEETQQQFNEQIATKEVVVVTKLSDYIKYVMGGIIAVVLLIAFPFVNILIKSHVAQSQFKNYKKDVEVAMQEIDNALINQHNADNKYYYNENALVAKVLKKQLKYDLLPDNNYKFTFSNGLYMILSSSYENDTRQRCNLFVEGGEKQRCCMTARIKAPLDDKTKKKYGSWGYDGTELLVEIFPNKTAKFGKW